MSAGLLMAGPVNSPWAGVRGTLIFRPCHHTQHTRESWGTGDSWGRLDAVCSTVRRGSGGCSSCFGGCGVERRWGSRTCSYTRRAGSTERGRSRPGLKMTQIGYKFILSIIYFWCTTIDMISMKCALPIFIAITVEESVF